MCLLVCQVLTDLLDDHPGSGKKVKIKEDTQVCISLCLMDRYDAELLYCICFQEVCEYSLGAGPAPMT